MNIAVMACVSGNAAGATAEMGPTLLIQLFNPPYCRQRQTKWECMNKTVLSSEQKQRYYRNELPS